jgi:N-acetylneuraminate synthase
MTGPADIIIDGRAIGPSHPPYVIAEMSGNHNGDIGRALALIEAAKAAGADAVKLQTYTADTITLDHDGPGFTVQGGLWDGRRLHALYREAHTPWDWHPRLFEHARAVGITAFSSPFDPTAVAFLNELGAPAFKVASFEIVDTPLIGLMAATGKPLIISTGLASPDDITEAVAAARAASGREIVLLHCTSGYPTPPSQMHLRTLPHLGEAHGTLVGLSDHSMGTAVSVAAVALGACVIEKHFTLARADGGPDAAFSLEPDELARLVADCRDAWAALGSVRYEEVEAEASSREHRRSLYVVADVARGEALTPANVRSIRPGYGLPPKHLPDVLGRRAVRDLSRGEPLSWSMLG